MARWLSFCVAVLFAVAANGYRATLDHAHMNMTAEDTGRSRSSRRRGYTAVSKPCGDVGESMCQQLVKDTLATLTCNDAIPAVFAPGYIDACIGGVLAPNDNHASTCCAAGTEFDNFLLDEASGVETMGEDDLVWDSETALAVIDMQNDFTVGSFAQPCWGQGHHAFIEEMVKTIKKAAAGGATVIASKDLHPADHCSFGGEDHCKNTKDYENEEFTADKRYVNQFPSHCSFSGFESHYASPQKAPDTPFCKGLVTNVFGGTVPPGHFCGDSRFIGAALDEKIAHALSELPPENVEIIFKGFNKEYDSFSAMPHLKGNPSEMEKTMTGGYAMPDDRATTCHGDWNRYDCYPSEDELKDPLGKGMRSMLDILNAKGIKKLYTIGLVFDYCVKETAIFATEAASEGKWNAGGKAESTVLAQLTRPSFDGKPGAPFVPAICDGGDVEDGLCMQGGGTTKLYQQVKKDYDDNGVKVTRFNQIDSC
eukprot:TRINITY_DN111507_c0_g1_i1.p1 TRINITY_DN111507_c0_g1~~TRINITY_DN111507_c0_g1_i1.p1  ORF type:complete len:481 (-),score=82.36 TRINITY_DN111507_c0_g1_i1:138-1580(-)